MDLNISKLINKVISGIKLEWTTDEKMRYVYIEVGKELSKDVTFFYSLGNKIGNENLDYHELKERYIDDKVIDNKVICKSAALILKSIYDIIGIKCRLMQSYEYQTISNENDNFDLYHWFLCCIGDNNKEYFLTLVPDLMNIQNGWQTEHFGTPIGYYKRTTEGIEPNPVYIGERINESIMSTRDLERLDMRVGYLKKKADSFGKVTPTSDTGPLDINDYIYYENGKKESGITLGKSPFIYDNIMDYVGGKRGYTSLLAEETEFFQEAFSFENKEGIIINFLEMPLKNISSEDICFWADLLQERIIDSTIITDDDKDKAMYQIEGIRSKLITGKNLITSICEKKIHLSSLKIGEDTPQDFKTLEFEIDELEKRALKNIQNARGLIFSISQIFIKKEYLLKKQSKEYNTEYILKRFEKLIPMILILNDKENETMLARCNGLGEQLLLIDKILKDLFDGNVIDVRPEKSRIIRTALYNSETKEYDLLFQIDKEHYYFINPRTGEFSAVPDPIGLITDNNYIVLNDHINERIAEIEREMGKAK